MEGLILALAGIIVLIVVFGLLFAAGSKALALFPKTPPWVMVVLEILALLFLALVIWHYFGPSVLRGL